MKNNNKNINVIYVCPAEKKPSGGVRIIYRHSEIINNLNKNYSSEVIHLGKKKISKYINSLGKFFKSDYNKYSGWNFNEIEAKKNFRYKWIKNNIKIKNNLKFTKNVDFIILPEIMAHLAEEICIKKKINYALFVQNGYALQATSNYKKLDLAYKKAKFIISYSDNITNCVKTCFPFCANKILKISYSIDYKKFNTSTKKKNIITYMPRKLPEHFDQLYFFLRKRLPKNWLIKKIHNITEEKVYKELLISKIFLAFSRMEGLPLPPVEAAIAGNKVIGYTGEGGKEYWQKPIFTEINNGNILKFTNEILKYTRIKKINKNFSKLKNKIIKKFSPATEFKNIIFMLKKISSIYC